MSRHARPRRTHALRRATGLLAAGALALAGVAATGATSQAHQSGSNGGSHGGSGGGSGGHDSRFKDLQILSFNDFHGNLEPPTGSSGRLVVDHALNASGVPTDITTDALTPPGVGGVEYLATHLRQARQGHHSSITVAAGDLVGASPLLSAAFHDEPTIEALNKLGLQVSAVGNHEFDEGYKELQRLQFGGCIADGDGQNNQNSCPSGRFRGADFTYLAANVRYARSKLPILAPFTIKNINGVKVGFIGMTLHDTPTIVTASGIQGLEFTDEVKTANALVPILKRLGVNAIVTLIHQGGTPGQQTWFGPDNKPYQVNPAYNAACDNGSSLVDSPILPIAQQLDSAIDLVISGHTHQPYVCKVKDPAGQDRLVTSASSFGRLFTDLELKYDTRTRDIVRASVKGSNVLVTRNVAADPAQTALISKYKTLVAPIANRELGSITTDVTRTGNPAGETPLGDLIADGQLADPSVVTGGQAPVIAFMNPGGIRADLTYAATPGQTADADGRVLYSEAFTVQPFSNYMVSMDITGQGVYDLLTQQVTGNNTGSAKKILQVSKGFSYLMSPTGPVAGSASLNGSPIDLGATYRIVANNFLSDGGDNFAAFTHATNKYFGGNDLDAFAAYLPTVSPYTPTVPPTRIGGTS